MNRILMMSAAALSLAACGERAPDGPSGRLSVAVQPLTLAGVRDATYTLRVKAGGQVVWEQRHLSSTRYGDGRGGLAYVGTCDASGAANTVELEIESLDFGAGPTAEGWKNPAPVGRPLAKSAPCVANADTAVTFDLTIMRAAGQGFVDLGVGLEDVFCSAKLDCADDQGQDLALLFPPGGEARATTVVVGFACTTGAGEEAWLHLSDVAVECGSGAGATTTWLSPAAGQGNVGPALPVFFQTAVYRGEEQLPDLDKCYWNMALGVNEGAAAADCHLKLSGTVSPEPFGPAGESPADTIWPYVHFDATLTDASGQVACGQNPLDGEDSNVTTDYTGFSGARFAHEWQCGSTPPTTARLACDGAIDGVGASFTESPDGIAVAFGNSQPDPDSPRYVLPEGARLSTECCLNPCCAE